MVGLEVIRNPTLGLSLSYVMMSFYARVYYVVCGEKDIF